MCSIILNWTHEEKDPMSSLLFVSLFISSIFFSESVLRVFLIFCMKLGENMGQKNDLTRFSKKISNFLKWQMRFFGILSKTAVRIFLIFWLVVSFIPRKPYQWTGFYMITASVMKELNDPPLYILYPAKHDWI